MDFGFDPQRALDQFKRLAADAPAQLADGFGRLIRDAPPERLEQVMRSPARRAVLDGIFWQMPKQLDSRRAAKVRTTIRWRITGRPDDGVDTYNLRVENGQAKTSRDAVLGEPQLTITMDAVEFLRLASGNSDPMSAYFKGRIQLTGDLTVAALLAQMFKMPGRGSSGPNNGRRRGQFGSEAEEP